MIALAALLASPPMIDELVSAAQVGDFDVSPDGARVIFAWDRLGDWDLFTVPIAGGEPHLLVGERGDDRAPRHSPDGARVAYEGAGEGGAADVFVVAASGGEARNLTRAAGSDHLIGWLAGGERLLVRADRGGKGFDLYAVDAVTGEGDALTRGGRVREAALAGDRMRVAFVTEERGDRGRLQTIDLSLSPSLSRSHSRRRARPARGPNVLSPRGAPSWFADGRILLAAFDTGPGRIGLWAPGKRAGNRAIDWQAGFSPEEGAPVASPLGDSYARLRYGDGAVEVRVASLSSRGDRAVATAEGTTRNVAWLPDTREIVFDRESSRMPRSLLAAPAHVSSAEAPAEARVIVYGAARLAPERLAAALPVWVPREGGAPLPAWLYAPHPPRARRGVIIVEEGPRGRVAPRFAPLAQALVVQGDRVLVSASA
ncbi:MAG: hypothetical protein AABZ30_05730, partial [Myxococcota bacterium]